MWQLAMGFHCRDLVKTSRASTFLSLSLGQGRLHCFGAWFSPAQAYVGLVARKYGNVVCMGYIGIIFPYSLLEPVSRYVIIHDNTFVSETPPVPADEDLLSAANSR